MAKGKRMADNSSHKSVNKRFKEEKRFNFKKFFIVFLIILILSVLVYVAYRYVPASIAKQKSDDSKFKSVSSNSISDTKNVEGLESISITGINISTSNKESSIIEIHFRNSSDTTSKETKAHFYALSSEDNIVFGMPLTIPEITANSETTYKVLCTSDLTEVKDYKISIE